MATDWTRCVVLLWLLCSAGHSVYICDAAGKCFGLCFCFWGPGALSLRGRPNRRQRHSALEDRRQIGVETKAKSIENSSGSLSGAHPGEWWQVLGFTWQSNVNCGWVDARKYALTVVTNYFLTDKKTY